MAILRISISGFDSAHLNEMRRTHSRTFRFPDGIDRLITLPQWHWQVFDKHYEHCDRLFIDTVHEHSIKAWVRQKEGRLDPVLDPVLPYDSWFQETAKEFLRFRDEAENEAQSANDN